MMIRMKSLLAGAAALFLGGLAFTSTPAEAHDGWRHQHRGPPPGYYHRPPPQAYWREPPRRMYYAPPARPYYYQPRPYYHRPPPPGVYLRF